MKTIDQSIVKKLRLPRPDSHKGDNGRLLIIAGSEKYHGSLIYAVKAASRIVDLIYVSTTKENRALIRKLKEKTAEIITVRHPELDSGSRTGFRLGGRNDSQFDCVLIGPGMGVSKRTYNLVRAVLRSKIKAVLDADALNVMDGKLLKLLHRDVILTPHKTEFKRVFKIDTKSTIVENMAIKHNCTIVVKGKVDVVASQGQGVGLNYTGNAGMTKGGTGDVLAGLIAALFCKNDAYTSAAAAVYVNGLAGDELFKRVGPYYDAEDLADEIPKTLWRLKK